MIFPRLDLIDIGGKQTAEISAFATAELNANSNITMAPGKLDISRSVTVLLLVSPETPDVCTRLTIDADDIFHILLQKAARVIPVFCNVQSAGIIFTRATTLNNLADIHSIFISDPSRAHDLEELRKHIMRLRARALSNTIIVAMTSLLLVAITVAATVYVQWLAPRPYYDLVIDADRATFVYNGKEDNLDKLAAATEHRRDTLKVLVVYTDATTYDATVQVINVLSEANIYLPSVEFASKSETHFD
jgi:hypothetical protein